MALGEIRVISRIIDAWLDNRPMQFRALYLGVLLCLAGSGHAQQLPAAVQAALTRSGLPLDAVSLLVVDAQTSGKPSKPRLDYRSEVVMNPASVMKLVTTYAALDLLGPAYTWTTPVYADGPVRDGTLQGNLYIQGQGDPKLVMERLWLLLRRLQGLGIRHIAGDIVLDNSAFDVPAIDPASFDGEPLRPYNAAPDALLINYKSVVMTFTPNRANNTAQVQFDPTLAGVQTQSTVPLSTGDCSDYRGTLKADFSDPNRIRFTGSYPAVCGEKVWPVAYAEPASYAARALQGTWLEMGGKLGGAVRRGQVPASLLAAGKPLLEFNSPALTEAVRDTNKFSSNVMAQQILLTLGRVVPVQDTAPQEPGTGPLVPGTFAAGRAVLLRWWKDRLDPAEMPVLDNGSGLSRTERITAQALGHLLQLAYRSSVMPELMASLPITGVDGTLKRVKSRATGLAHLKTGSLSNVVAVAGYVHAASGKRYVLVAMVNHPNANAARPVIDALVDWAAKDGGTAAPALR
jgi:D-alanyl-D-alanine carboxypeptidase/D-alanyl-D-alanine-endopeptidase (penicillin-binding protein 4)